MMHIMAKINQKIAAGRLNSEEKANSKDAGQEEQHETHLAGKRTQSCR
jgi:hypothetical protein